MVLLFSCQSANTDTKQARDNDVPEYTGPIIDMHLHAYTEGTGGMLGMTHPPTLRGETYPGTRTAEEHRKQTLEILRKNNVVKAVVTNADHWVPEAPEMILLGRGSGSLDSLRKHYQNNKLQVVAELSPFYAGKLAYDPSVLPYFELAAELELPVGFHIFPGGPNGGFHLMPEMLGGMRAYNANPMQIEEVLASYPDLKVYIMHGGWPYIEDIKALMYAHPQLYVDIAVVNWILPEEELHYYLTELIRSGFGDRIMYGSDQMVWPQVIEIGIASVNSAPITQQQKEDIFYNNAARFLGLSEEEITEHKNRTLNP
jgi:hypothetical protein